jgi:cytoskeletal protein CcmA (bactofilin family)
LTIGPHATVKANISAKTVVVLGALIGNVAAEEKVEIGATGSLNGDITSRRLTVVDGGLLNGKIVMARMTVDTSR